jgi:hypothetical protein
MTIVVWYGWSAVAAHGCQSGVDKVVEAETATLATRLCWNKVWRCIEDPRVTAERATTHRKKRLDDASGARQRYLLAKNSMTNVV